MAQGQRCLALAAAALAACGRASDENTVTNWPYEDARQLVIDGCYYKGRRYMPPLNHPLITTNTHQECQIECQKHEDCLFFGFYQESLQCWLGGEDSTMVNTGATDCISGPKNCPEVPSGCTEVPNSKFPGLHETTTALSFPSNRVPEMLECWPYSGSGGWYNVCPESAIIDDTYHGWPGNCQDVEYVTLPAGETCESQCLKNEMCSVFQIRQDGSCWQAVGSPGLECFTKTVPSPIVYAGRVMHGSVRSLLNLTGVAITGLTKAFGPDEFIDPLRNGPQACRFTCYSYLPCQYWVYCYFTGCWVEAPDLGNWPTGFVQFPPTDKVWHDPTDDPVIAGEYVQHLCPGTKYIPANANQYGVWAPQPASDAIIFATEPWAAQALTGHGKEEVAGGGSVSINVSILADASAGNAVAAAQRGAVAPGGASLWLAALSLGFALPLAAVCARKRRLRHGWHVAAAEEDGGSLSEDDA